MLLSALFSADHCAADTMPAFTRSHWQQTHGHSIFAGLGGMRSQGKEGGTKCKRKWQGKEEGAWWDGEEVQAVVLSMEGIGQACVIGGFCTVLR